MMTEAQKARYARHLLLPGFGEDAQLKLLRSKVLLIGAGGLGSPSALYLAAAGVGHLTIIDHDTVDESNLQRQILHRSHDVGQPKVESARRELLALNPELQITLHQVPFTQDNALSLVEEHDLVIDGSDNFTTRFLSNDACFFARVPLVYGSIFQFEGQLTMFDYRDESPCYRCLVPAVPDDGTVPNCLEAGVIGTLPGIIGSMQAMEAIKYLAGVGTPPVGKMLYYSALDTSFREISIQKDPACPLCSDSPTITSLKEEKTESCALDTAPSITCDELISLMQTEDIFLLDVREPAEFAQHRLPGSQFLPLSTLKNQIPELPRDRPIYVHCKAGLRSLKAINLLKEQGYSRLINISDGIDGLSSEINRANTSDE